MTVVLLANVGSRDVVVDGTMNLPRDSRPLGEMILADYDNFHERLRLPLLSKTLEGILPRHGGRLDRIVLFASDQADPRYRHTDTMPFAQIVKRYLGGRYDDRNYPWVDAATTIIQIEGNPADFDEMMRFYGKALHEVGDVDTAYLAVTGGTPAMSFMLLWQGVEHLGDRAAPLYVTQERPVPNLLNIGQTLAVRAVRNDLETALRAYQYTAASAILRDHETLLVRAWGGYRTLLALVTYAEYRANFNFALAASALLGAERGANPATVEAMHAFADETAAPDDYWLLREEVIGAALDFERGAYKDAVANIFAFREGVLRQLAQLAGAQLIDGRKLDPAWLDAQAGLRSYLEGKGIDLTRNATTFVFERILDFMARRGLSDQHRAIYTRVGRLIELSDLRNSSTHNHKGVSREDVEEKYGGSLESLRDDLWAIFASLSGDNRQDEPYARLNTLILSLVEDAS